MNFSALIRSTCSRICRFTRHLRYPAKDNAPGLGPGGDCIYLAVFALLVHAAVSRPYLRPVSQRSLFSGSFSTHLVQANVGIITFQYTFVLDYLMVIRACAFFICQTVFPLRILLLAVQAHLHSFSCS